MHNNLADERRHKRRCALRQSRAVQHALVGGNISGQKLDAVKHYHHNRTRRGLGR